MNLVAAQRNEVQVFRFPAAARKGGNLVPGCAGQPGCVRSLNQVQVFRFPGCAGQPGCVLNLVPLFEPGSGLFALPAAIERDTIELVMGSRMITVRFRGRSAHSWRAAALNC
jgi:hypothetical protein